ncbi:MAG: MraY family glycosyltransferase [Phycisphaerae bacterium]
MLLGIGLLGGLAFTISLVATFAMIRIAPRIGFTDKPGTRKIHHVPKPLGGGVGIYLGLVLPLLFVASVLAVVDPPPPPPVGVNETFEELPVEFFGLVSVDAALVRGAQAQLPLAMAFLGCLTAMHVMGLADDVLNLGPFIKLAVQLAAAAVLAVIFPEMRVLTTLGPALSIIVTVLWITAVTNAFNFLDNMDGLSAGVAAVCTVAFLLTTLLIAQWFVAATLAVLLGAVMGFLVFNFPPARIFQGDAGSLLLGFTLGVLTVRTTYLPPESATDEAWGAGWYAVFAPVIVLALPLYDLVTVSIIRISQGRSPFQGDTNHFSHRLVARGMSRRTAVLCLYLVTAATSAAAVILPYTTTGVAAVMVFAQTLLILGVVALLEQHPVRPPATEPTR